MKVQTLLATGLTACLLAGLSASANAQELLTNPGFEDLDMDGSAGDGWGSYGAAGFNAFFGDNAHASLFADNAGNFGGVFQQGIAGSEGLTYSFDLTDVRIESNFDASLRFGLEYYPADDATLISADLVEIFAPGDGMPTGDGLTFSMTSSAPAGTAFVRPIVQFDQTNGSASGQENAFVFDASLAVAAVPEPASMMAMAFIGGLGLLRRR